MIETDIGLETADRLVTAIDFCFQSVNAIMLNNDHGKTKNRRLSHSKRRDSAVLSMPKMFKPTELQYTSPITKFQTFRVEDNAGTGQEFYMKAIKNGRCVQLSLKHELEQAGNFEHPNLVRVISINLSDYYSYVVFQKYAFICFRSKNDINF